MRREDRYDSLIRYYSRQAGFLGPTWLRFKAQIKAESNFEPKAVSHVGAKGLGQFMPMTWVEWGVDDIFNPEANIESQIRYMRWLLNRPAIAGEWDRAFAAYNWGIGNVSKLKDNPDWLDHLPDETSKYVKRIDQYFREYQHDQLKGLPV